MPDDVGLRPRASSARTSLIDAITRGLNQTQKTLPPKLFYDDEGCRLFGLITRLDEYYVTRAEMRVLAAHAAEIASCVGPGAALVEYGASDETKADTLLSTGRFSTYVPIDIAEGALGGLRSRLSNARPGLNVIPLVADFTQPLLLPRGTETELLGFFPGSTIGNFDPEMVVAFLRLVRMALGAGGVTARFVVGTDLRKDARILIPAYDDAQGVTAAFNRNMLTHVNSVADADFDPSTFRHRVRWNEAEGRIEMHLESVRAQEVRVADTTVRFRAGETIHTESSYKHTQDGFLALARRAGWSGSAFWTDEERLFGIHLLEARA